MKKNGNNSYKKIWYIVVLLFFINILQAQGESTTIIRTLDTHISLEMINISPLEQTVLVEEVLDEPPIVKIINLNGYGVEGISIEWTLTPPPPKCYWTIYFRK
jgi:hypothetical protein